MDSIVWLMWLGVSGVAFLRLVRWVAFVQQKEYRVDRLRLFLQSETGLRELLRLFPPQNELQTLRFRRPALTLRAVVTLSGVGVASGLFGWVGYLVLSAVMSSAWAAVVASGFIWMCVPLIVLLVALPPTVVVQLYSQLVLRKAAARLRKSKAEVIGITGSFGKTSTKLLLAAVLGGESKAFATPRSFNTRLSVARSILSGYRDQRYAIIECGAYRIGEIAAIAGAVQPSIAIVTGFAPQHLGLFGSAENIVTAKQELVTAVTENGVVVIGNETAEQIVTREIRPDLERIWAEEQAVSGSLSSDGYLVLSYKNKKYTTQLVGLQYLDTVRTVWAVGEQLGVSAEQMLERLEAFVPPEQFVQQYQLQSGARVIDDGGTANPAGFRAALKLLGELKCEGERYVVTPGIVDLGSESDAIHEELADKIAAVGAGVWHVGDEGAAAFQAAAPTYTRDQAEITRQLASLKKQDILLIEGRMPVWFLKVLAQHQVQDVVAHTQEES